MSNTIRIDELTLNIEQPETHLHHVIMELLGIGADDIKEYKIIKKAIDSRKKREMIYFRYSVEVTVEDAKKLLCTPPVKKNMKRHRIRIVEHEAYDIPSVEKTIIEKRPIVVGNGPSGLFAALYLAKAGAKPLVIERGKDVDARIEDVNHFEKTGELHPESNIQFGEGGAGTFSDGKLYTVINNPRLQFVFESFVNAGAPEHIMWDAKPHIGTDNLRKVVKEMRKEIIALGGEVRFETCLTDIVVEEGQLKGIVVNKEETIETNDLVLAIGYSARDTYTMLYERGIEMAQRGFSMGVRIEHTAEMINKAQYDKFHTQKKLGAATYKLVAHSDELRSVYSFCMCPGGYVVPAASEAGCLVTNGMSEYKQDGNNSNSALLVNVGPEDFENDHPLAGMRFQKEWEEKAFALGGFEFKAPAQLVGDFLAKRPSTHTRSVTPSYKPGVTLTELDKCLPKVVAESIRAALPVFHKKIVGFAHKDAVLTGIETRSSSPLRLVRDKVSLESNIAGLYPAGEGAGYAGGIVSSAVDGLKVAEVIVDKYL
ncbi:hypothetical protein KKG22_00985 [Patescibacteria group bacterium]|nr:hypothetical protein [Patescibacteria group bacterium]MBU1722010.1 hypothetical protein [Patescibacteria group bacterium]MBU1901240.1 hypothetical protein [Patescibacteria group bacterium]